ncbi:MAG: phasin family protein [Chloroflexi bacterium]|nr:phasin family protein [Chloroflexota bacterium]MBP8059295.1 phasin family protein [Chloroflexota bacterium]
MEDVTIEINEETPDNTRNQMVEMARKVLLAGVGAVALAQDEVEAFVNRLIERGEIAEKDGRKLINDVMDRRKKQMEDTQAKAKESLEGRVEAILHRMNIPTKSDIQLLSEKISALAKKVDQLKKG